MYAINLKNINYINLDAVDEDGKQCISISFNGYGKNLTLNGYEARAFLESVIKAGDEGLMIRPDEWRNELPAWLPLKQVKAAA